MKKPTYISGYDTGTYQNQFTAWQNYRIDELERALTKIASWELPAINDHAGKPGNYEIERGSNGAKRFIRAIAREALG